jgi:hypothetical protein
LFDGIEEYETKYLDGKMQKQQVLAELRGKGVDVNNYRWYAHIRDHVQPAVSMTAMEIAPDLAQDMIDMVGDVGGIIDRLKKKAQQMGEDMEDVTDVNTIKAWVSLEVALGQALERAGRITGDLKGVTNVKQQNIKVEFNNFAGQVLQDACPTCKAKFAETLEPIIKKIK